MIRLRARIPRLGEKHPVAEATSQRNIRRSADRICPDDVAGDGIDARGSWWICRFHVLARAISLFTACLKA